MADEIFFDTELIDEVCREIFDHSNWVFFTTLTKAEKEQALKDDCKTAYTIVFYEEPLEEEEEE